MPGHDAKVAAAMALARHLRAAIDGGYFQVCITPGKTYHLKKLEELLEVWREADDDFIRTAESR